MSWSEPVGYNGDIVAYRYIEIYEYICVSVLFKHSSTLYICLVFVLTCGFSVDVVDFVC